MRYAWLLSIAGFLLLFVPCGAGQTQEADPPQSKEASSGILLIKGGTIFTMTGGEAWEGDILVRSGKIKALGREMKLPSKVPMINARGRTILPGFVDANSVYLLHSPNKAVGRADADVLDDFDYFQKEKMEWALSRGVTAMALTPPSGDGIRGRCAVVKLIPGASLDEMKVKERIALKAGLGTGALGVPFMRMMTAAALDKKFKEAKQYEEAWKTYEEELEEYLKKIKPAGGEEPEKKETEEAPEKEEKKGEKKEKKDGDEPPKGGGRFARGAKEEEKKEEKEKEGKAKKKEEEPKKPREPAFNMEKDILLEAMRGEVDFQIEVHRASDILEVLKWKKKHCLDLVLVGCTEGYMVADEIREAGVPVILGSVARPRSRERNAYFNHCPESAACLAAKKIPFALASSGRSSEEVRFLSLNAALAAGHGLAKEKALQAITIRAAEILGVDDRLGSIEKGKDADLVIMSGHPFESDARVDMVLINGRVVYERKK